MGGFGEFKFCLFKVFPRTSLQSATIIGILKMETRYMFT